MREVKRRSLSARGRPDSRFDVLHEGVPAWLRADLATWVLNQLAPEVRVGDEVDGYATYERPVRAELVGRLVRTTLRMKVPDDPEVFVFGMVRSYPSRRPETFLDVIDFLLFELQPSVLEPSASTGRPWLDNLATALRHVGPGAAADKLERILHEGGSAWQVGVVDGHWALTRRQLAGTAASFDHAVSTAPDEAGRHLSAAWRAITQRPLDPERAWDAAIRAVEVVVNPVVIPDDHIPTLGKALARLRSAPHLFATAITTGQPDGGVVSLEHMARLLWAGHETRHARPGETPPSLDQAVSAVHLATALVGIVASGGLGRK